MTGKAVTLQVSKKGVQALPVKTVKAKTPSASSKKKKTKKPTLATLAAGSLSSQGGQLNEIEAHALNVTSMMNESSALSNDGKSSIMTILNPCGELGSDSNARFPDGTLSQSGIQRFRQFETIVAPWQTISSSQNVTNNWSLYIISPSAFRTIAVFIAVRDGRALTDAEFNQVFNLINTTIDNPEYPAWDSVGLPIGVDVPNIYYTIYPFKSATLDIDPTTGESKTIESFRVVGDGMVVLHNTPDLWNQGSFAVGQFKTDFAVVETDTTSWPVVVEIAISSITPTVYTGDLTAFFEDSVGNRVILAMIPGFTFLKDGTSQNLVFSSPGGAYHLLTKAPGGESILNWNGTDQTVVVNADAVGNFNFVGPATPGGSWTMSGINAVGNYTYLAQGFGVLFQTENFNPSQIIWSLPSLNQDAIAQADPKFSAELMKCHDGFYAVRRYFEPVLNMTNSNSSGPIKLELRGLNKQDIIDGPGGIKGDILDKNGSTIIAAIRGISYANSPTIKTCRFVEFMPSPNSALAPFVGPTPAKDEDAVEIFRQMQLSGPHSFIPDANFLGGLATFVMSVIEKVPLFLRTARSVSTAVVNALDWAETKMSSMGFK